MNQLPGPLMLMRYNLYSAAMVKVYWLNGQSRVYTLTQRQSSVHLFGSAEDERGMGEIAKSAGLNRESLYKALGETGNPEFGTVMRIVRALGLTLSARPAATRRTSKSRRVA